MLDVEGPVVEIAIHPAECAQFASTTPEAALRVLHCVASNKEGKTPKCFTARRLQVFSPEISLSVVLRPVFAT
jgi:hypothetical protein